VFRGTPRGLGGRGVLSSAFFGMFSCLYLFLIHVPSLSFNCPAVFSFNADLIHSLSMFSAPFNSRALSNLSSNLRKFSLRGIRLDSNARLESNVSFNSNARQAKRTSPGQITRSEMLVHECSVRAPAAQCPRQPAAEVYEMWTVSGGGLSRPLLCVWRAATSQLNS
jgi:hypothetical protein